MRNRLMAAALAGFLAAMLWAAPLAAQDAVRVDDFDRTHKPNETYGKWDTRKIAPFFGDGDTYFFQFYDQGGEHYIHLKSGDDNSFSLGVEQDYRVQDWPVLAWEWRVTTLPKDGDVRVKARDDQAGSICVIVNPGLMGFKSLCYIYENDGPKGEVITSTKRDDSKYIILRTGTADGTGTWYSEQRNTLEDFTGAFGYAPEEKAIIGIQIDSDSTESSAEAFYRNIYRRKP